MDMLTGKSFAMHKEETFAVADAVRSSTKLIAPGQTNYELDLYLQVLIAQSNPPIAIVDLDQGGMGSVPASGMNLIKLDPGLLRA